MARGNKRSLKAKILTSLGVLIVAITALWGYNHYMAEQKLNNLYKHGFRLLEEQIATYIVENYSGVSKVEFSPIFVDGDGKYTINTAYVVPIIYDKHGSKARLGGVVNQFAHPRYGLLNYLNLSIDINDDEMIELSDSSGDFVAVKMGDKLPEAVRWIKNDDIDNNIKDLIATNQLDEVTRDSKGSPDAQIKYNLVIEQGRLNYDAD